MGEAVYRLLFSEFDGITDRIPVEAVFGLVFAWLATEFVGDAYRNRKQRSARLNLIFARNHLIRGALEGITPLAGDRFDRIFQRREYADSLGGQTTALLQRCPNCGERGSMREKGMTDVTPRRIASGWEPTRNYSIRAQPRLPLAIYR